MPPINKANSALCVDSFIEQCVQNKNKAGRRPFFPFLPGATARDASSWTEAAFAPAVEQKVLRGAHASHLESQGQTLQDGPISRTLSRCSPRLTIRADDRVELLARKTHPYSKLSYVQYLRTLLEGLPWTGSGEVQAPPLWLRSRGLSEPVLRRHVQAATGTSDSLPCVLPQCEGTAGPQQGTDGAIQRGDRRSVSERGSL